MKQTYLPFSNPKLPPGAVFAAKKPGVSITGYKSRKVMFQGVNGEAEAKKMGSDSSRIQSKSALRL